MKKLTDYICNEASNILKMTSSCMNLSVPKNTVVFAVYSNNGDDLMLWAPNDADEMAELLMRKFTFDFDVKKNAETLLKLESGENKFIKDSDGTKINITCIK